MRDYELVFIVSPEVAEENLTATLERVSRFITGKGGEISNMEPWGRRKLAYPIKNHREGHYVLAHFRLDPKDARELEASLNISEEVIRHLLVRLDER